ncbi:MAG: beta-propeller fold lactonase family protein [Chloroflexales bacterium]|nr:beta-propeller fold lactonase family protein [Chloroflexales bacterium]
MRQGMFARIAVALLLVCVGLTTFGQGGVASAASAPAGAVYALTNAADGNAVAIFNRAGDGTLTAASSVPTGGLGTGAGLGSQGALAFGKNGKLLFAVNAGSNEISTFKVGKTGLTLVDRVASGGVLPISLTTHDDTLYVLNAGASGNITGFRIREGKLVPLPDTTRPLSSAAADPAQVQFNPDGDLLAVTEKATNTIDTYRIDDGAISGPFAQPAVGTTPFGFVFDDDNRLIVSEAFGGAAGAGAVSSYRVEDDGAISPATGSLANQQSAPCWVALSKNGRYAYVANTGSGTVSAYKVGDEGALTLLNGVAGVTGDGTRPADLGVSKNGRFLYVRNGGTGTISAFRVQSNGGLVSLGTTGALLSGSAGIAIR